MKGLLWRWLGGAHAPPSLTFSKIGFCKFRIFQKLFAITENICFVLFSCIFGIRMKKDSASLDRAHRVRPFWLVVCPSRAPASPPRPLLLPHMWGLRCFIACKVQSALWPKLEWARVNCLTSETLSVECVYAGIQYTYIYLSRYMDTPKTRS